MVAAEKLVAYKMSSALATISVTPSRTRPCSHQRSGPPQEQPDSRTETIAKLFEAIVDLNLVGHAPRSFLTRSTKKHLDFSCRSENSSLPMRTTPSN